MAIEKGLYEAPAGIDEDMGEGEEVGLEIEVVNPDMVTLDDGSVEITLVAGEDLGATEFTANLAEDLDDNVLASLADELIDYVDSDVEGRKDWADTFVKGLDVLGFKYEERTDPWDGACGVYSTVLAEAAIRFQAETMSETFPAAGPVRTKILGEETSEKEEAANRVRADMNYELTEQMVEYRPEHERMLYSLGLAGSAFKKVYYDPNLGRQIAIYIPAEDVIVPYGASHIESAERVTHVMRKTKNELKKLQANGFYRDVDLGDPQAFHTDIEKRKAEEGGFSITDDERYALYEIHADLVIDGAGDSEDDEIARPYVVTIERGTYEVLSIRRNWNPDDPLMLKRQHFVHYVYVPGFGFYGLGLIHIIGGYARAGTSIIRQLVDAGTLSNLPGGLKTRGLRIKGDDTPIEPGEWRDVDVPSGSVRDNIMPLPYKEPSQTLLALLDKITNEGRRLGAISDMNISDMSANAPVGTTLALLERTLKPMAAVQARVHYAMKQEFKLLKAIMAEYAPAEYGYQPLRGEVTARQADYALVDVIPVSDPNSSTMAQRVVQYQAVLQMAQSAPQIYDLPALHRQMIEVLGVKNADKLVPTTDDMKPADPVSENMDALNGKPMKAFIYQDHDAHIATHTSFMQDPMVAKLIGQNPQAQQIMASLQAHIAEHLGFSYRKQIEERLGVPLPAPNENLPEVVEINLARLMADAGKQLTQSHQQQAAQQQAQQQNQDPVLQLQRQEMATKEAEVQRKTQKDQMDMQLRMAEQQRKAQSDKVGAIIEAQKLELEKTSLIVDAQKDKVKVDAALKADADKLDLEIFKTVTAPNKGK
tara:strand:- start:3565 stop:6024 length:2460 start_codon:yes stop_codon:yes gene_type:complete